MHYLIKVERKSYLLYEGDEGKPPWSIVDFIVGWCLYVPVFKQAGFFVDGSLQYFNRSPQALSPTTNSLQTYKSKPEKQKYLIKETGDCK